MASITFDSFVAAAVREVDNKNADHETFLREATIRALQQLGPERTLLMQDSTSITMVVDQSAYTLDLPNVLEIQLAYVLESSTWQRDLSRKSLSHLRAFATPSSAVSYWPTMYCWFKQQILIGPRPTSASVVVYLDVMLDATRDEATGDEIVSTSTGATNPWFGRGLPALRNFVMADYYLTIAKNPDAARGYATMAGVALSALKREWHLQHPSAQASFGI